MKKRPKNKPRVVPNISLAKNIEETNLIMTGNKPL